MKAFLICLMACVALSTATKFEDCGSKQVTVKKVDVQDCPDGPERCTLEKNATKSISIEFEATNSSAREIKVELYSWQNGFPWLFDDDRHDGCKGHGLQCPLEIGDTYTYTGEFYILEEYPTSENVVIEWEMVDDKYNHFLCIHVPSRTEEKSKIDSTTPEMLPVTTLSPSDSDCWLSLNKVMEYVHDQKESFSEVLARIVGKSKIDSTTPDKLPVTTHSPSDSDCWLFLNKVMKYVHDSKESISKVSSSTK